MVKRMRLKIRKIPMNFSEKPKDKKLIFISKELVEELEKTIQIEVNDLKLKDFERGFKAGQMEVLMRIQKMYKLKEAING